MNTILFLAAAVLGTVALWLLLDYLVRAATTRDGAPSRERARERFPPISDAEFLARCTPGTNPKVALKVRQIVAEFFAIEYERVHPSSSFVDDLGA
jgi:hypothetical protein